MSMKNFDHYKKSVAMLLNRVKEESIKIHDARQQLTLEGKEEVEIDGTAYIGKARVKFQMIVKIIEEE
jgi:hypothetical protein